MIGSATRSLFTLLAVGGASLTAVGQEPTVRSTAVVDLNFDEVDGPAEDRAAGGAAKDSAAPVNGPARVTSPFWNVRGGRAVRFDAAKGHLLQVADSADLDHATGTTLSFFYLNLHDLSDAAFHGIVAKRSPTEQKTNYGLNYQPSSGRLQVYVHDGSGFKTVNFPIAEAFGYRRLAHLTATFRLGDAPEPDADGDADDLEIRLHANGKPLKPTDATGGPVVADAGWITDVNFAGLPNDTPLTIGASAAGLETTSAVFDELLVFNRPLSSEEAAKLFAEVASPDAERLAKLEAEAAPSSVPVVTDVTPRGLQVGGTTRLIVAGQNLGPEPVLSTLGVQATATVLPESTPQRLVVDVAVPAEVAPTVVPLAVRTGSGISSPLPLPVDRLPQRMMAEVASDRPASLPGAFTGVLSGTDRPRLAFDGNAGETFVAEAELKRLGGGADPVLELKTDAGTPVEIAWGQVRRGGDPRLVAVLPRDGRYILELHDLAYQAPASPYRLLAGNLRLLDAVIPAAVTGEESRRGTAVGAGTDGGAVEIIGTAAEPTAKLAGPTVAEASGALPVVPRTDGRELTEASVAAESVDIGGSGLAPTYVTGQLVERGEVDRFRLRVQAGQPLELRLDAVSAGSSIEPVLTVVEQGKPPARQAAAPGMSTVSLAVTPQAADGFVEVHVADRLRGAGMSQTYRLRVAPAGTPECRVTGLDSAVTLPASGRGVMRVRIERAGGAGAVTLIPDEASGVTVEPATLAAGAATEEVFVTLAAAGRPAGEWLSMTAEVATPNGPMRRPVKFALGPSVDRFDANRPHFRIPIVTSASAPSLELAAVPAVAFKGMNEAVALKFSGEVPEGYAIRLSLVSDESTRPADPKNPAAGLKPLIRLSDDFIATAGAAESSVPLVVPSDVAAAEIRAVVKAEVVPHAYSDRVAAVGYSAPLRLAVKEAIAAIEPAGPASLKAGENRQVKVLVKRGEGFARPVRVELRGLPAGFTSPAIDLPPDQVEATFTVSVPAGTAAGPVPNVELAVTGAEGSLLKTVTPFAVEVTP